MLCILIVTSYHLYLGEVCHILLSFTPDEHHLRQCDRYVPHVRLCICKHVLFVLVTFRFDAVISNTYVTLDQRRLLRFVSDPMHCNILAPTYTHTHPPPLPIHVPQLNCRKGRKYCSWHTSSTLAEHALLSSRFSRSDVSKQSLYCRVIRIREGNA